MFKLRKYKKYDPFTIRTNCIPLLFRGARYDANLGANYYDPIISGLYNKFHEFNGSYFRICNMDDNINKPYEESTWGNIIFDLRNNILERRQLEDSFEKTVEIQNQVRGLLGFMLTEQSIKGLGTTIQEVKNVLLSRTLFKNQVGTFQIVWDYSSHLLNFLDPEYKEYLENSRKFIRMLPSSSEKEAKWSKKIALDISFYVQNETTVFIAAPPWEFFFFVYLMFLNEIYYLFPIYHLHNTGLLEIFGDQTQGTYEYFIQECKEHYYSDKFDKTIQSLFHKNFLTDKELIQLFFDTCRNSYREIYEFASKMSQEDYKKFIHNHGMDSCFDWMGGFENLERFFFNAILAQYIKIFTSCHVNWSDGKNPLFKEFGFNQKKFIDQAKKEQKVENLEDYFYFYWDFNITGTVGNTWDNNLYEGWILNGMVEQYGLDTKTPLHHRGLVSEQLKQNLTHWIRGLKNSWGMSQDDIIPIWGLYPARENFTNKFFGVTLYGDHLQDLPSPFYQFTQHYILNHCDLGSLHSIIYPPLPQWRPY